MIRHLWQKLFPEPEPPDRCYAYPEDLIAATWSCAARGCGASTLNPDACWFDEITRQRREPRSSPGETPG